MGADRTFVVPDLPSVSVGETARRTEINLTRLLESCERMQASSSSDASKQRILQYCETASQYIEQLRDYSNSHDKATERYKGVSTATIEGWERQVTSIKAELLILRTHPSTPVATPLPATATGHGPMESPEVAGAVKSRAGVERDLRDELLGRPSPSMSRHSGKSSLQRRRRHLQYGADADDMGAVESVLRAHREEQDVLADEISAMAAVLQGQSQTISEQLKRDIATIEGTTNVMQENTSDVKEEHNRLQGVMATSKGNTWLSVAILVVVLITFIGMYLMMKIFPKWE